MNISSTPFSSFGGSNSAAARSATSSTFELNSIKYYDINNETSYQHVNKIGGGRQHQLQQQHKNLDVIYQPLATSSSAAAANVVNRLVIMQNPAVESAIESTKTLVPKVSKKTTTTTLTSSNIQYISNYNRKSNTNLQKNTANNNTNSKKLTNLQIINNYNNSAAAALVGAKKYNSSSSNVISSLPISNNYTSPVVYISNKKEATPPPHSTLTSGSPHVLSSAATRGNLNFDYSKNLNVKNKLVSIKSRTPQCSSNLSATALADNKNSTNNNSNSTTTCNKNSNTNSSDSNNSKKAASDHSSSSQVLPDIVKLVEKGK